MFEAALMESRRMSMSFITPEHILLAVLAVGDASSRKLLEGCAGVQSAGHTAQPRGAAGPLSHHAADMPAPPLPPLHPQPQAD